ncbi:phosphodiester glycosidase family protein [Pontibacter roseus]|uniref:phosphodiester glycosidase family protein n=1 Tax=Pontibacter roseus TaxID=336989 RepID=UPI00037C12FD|nr:phosphodiester glycosidase family protein [Pontibacter roseus]
MKKLFLLPFLFNLLLTAAQPTPVLAQSPGIAQETNIEQALRKKHWQTEKVGRGMRWKYYHGNGLFASRQSINMLDINLRKAGIQVRFAYSDSTRIKTSDFAREQGAVAAINGSYFDVKNGGSVNFFRTGGQINATSTPQLPAYRENAAIAVDVAGKVSIIRKPKAGWETTAIPELLSSGPLLVFGGQVEAMVPQAFNTNRHPRTAIGITSDNHLLLVTVDGRSAEAQGMTNAELAQLMLTLGCTEALNLDGGGSTTLWIDGRGTNGIVNFPSDNKAYDHEGERAVANSVLILKKGRD